jgi:short-subunit dehydrogenase
LLVFFQAVDKALGDTWVEVKPVCPGGMKTNMLANAVGK